MAIVTAGGLRGRSAVRPGERVPRSGAERLGAQALVDPSIDRSLLLAREGVNLVAAQLNGTTAEVARGLRSSCSRISPGPTKAPSTPLTVAWGRSESVTMQKRRESLTLCLLATRFASLTLTRNRCG
jgi:hypothetical protein